ncbi:MAG: STAS domain-containing protein [Lachnospiraceae bacterium]|nr:STAS domain-containing protein [Lachnospiraceae bacterium]
MQINKSVDNNVLNVSLSGRLDTMTAPELEAAVKTDLENVTSAVLDLKDLEYVSSAGLRIILTMHKTLAGKNGLTVKNPNETVDEVFDITGFSDILNIEK